MTLVRSVAHDVAAERTARARMAEIEQSLADNPEQADLQAELATLDGSWLIETWEDRPDVLDADQAAAAQAEAERIAWNDDIKAQLAANDVAVVRALTEGDQERINAHAEKQSALRAQLR